MYWGCDMPPAAPTRRDKVRGRAYRELPRHVIISSLPRAQHALSLLLAYRAFDDRTFYIDRLFH